MIDRATDRVLITTAYFIPDKEVLQALVDAARRGVTVRVLIPEYSNHILADWAVLGRITGRSCAKGSRSGCTSTRWFTRRR